MFSAFESFIKGDVEVESAAAEEPEAEATETQAETSEAATGPDLMSSLWSGLSYVGESVQAGIAAQQEALDQAMASNQAPKSDLEGGSLPWEGCSEDVANQIIALSQDERPFVQPAPSVSKYSFDLNAHTKTAVAVMQADPRLAELRYKLVPDRISDDTFWRNYFFRVRAHRQIISTPRWH